MSYKMDFNKTHYERIELAVPKGMKDIIKNLAAQKSLSVNAYLLDLVHQDQMGIFDSMQIAEKNKEQIRSMEGNTHDGYTIIFKDGAKVFARSKLEARRAIINHCK